MAALNTGEVEQNKDDNYIGDNRGNYIMLTHDSGLATRYLHLTVVLVTEDEKVTGGQMIGTAGSTGHSDGPHLHFDYGNPARPTSEGKMAVRRNPLTELYPPRFLDYLREASAGQ